ncbi:hypothetical protein ACFORG_13735 [Lutimaribacter marinistellae]|uniref:Uncharacterized protein n=1 Tax=Lutimaribacter marinistellae TaxID=1820329 RepID=A0ABV7TKX0_9RHOB
MLRWFFRWAHDQPGLVRISIAVAVGAVSGWISNELGNFQKPLHPCATVGWALAFFIGIFQRNRLHRTLSFAVSRTTNETSPRGEPVVIGCITMSRAGPNFLLTKVAAPHHRLTRPICLGGVSALGYALMKLYPPIRQQSEGLS